MLLLILATKQIVLNITVIWYVTSRGYLSALGGTYCLHLQDKKEICCEDGGRKFLRNF
jgi:hypothetical protein